LALLKECIPSLRTQTYKADAIIVINNDSTDGTAEWLKEQTDLQVIHQENIGGAGGFYRGIKEAYEQGFDWIWVMDDDVEPQHDCLENLLAYKAISGCIHPTRKYSDGKLVDGELIWDLSRDSIMFLENTSYKNGKEFYTSNNACFEGMLISRTVVDKIGYPDKRFFFVYDDLIYGFFASLYTNVIFVRSALLIRKKLSSSENWSPLYMYYSHRNKHLVMEYHLKFFPNANHKIIQKSHLLSPLHTIKMVLKLKNYSWDQKKKLIDATVRGFLDGRRKKVGR
ncbi:MAG TPA: glycosyltransferase family 2 protein, partial [Segetibacter sp.]